jgi:hypothetical protein
LKSCDAENPTLIGMDEADRAHRSCAKDETKFTIQIQGRLTGEFVFCKSLSIGESQHKIEVFSCESEYGQKEVLSSDNIFWLEQDLAIKVSQFRVICIFYQFNHAICTSIHQRLE